MKDNLDKECRASLIAYRIERSCGSMKEAEFMAHYIMPVRDAKPYLRWKPKDIEAS